MNFKDIDRYRQSRRMALTLLAFALMNLGLALLPETYPLSLAMNVVAAVVCSFMAGVECCIWWGW